MAKVYIVGTHRANGPARQIFETTGVAYPTFEEAVQTAVDHWKANFGGGKTPEYRVHVADDKKTAFVEILDTGATMTCLGLYKIAGMFTVGGAGAEEKPAS